MRRDAERCLFFLLSELEFIELAERAEFLFYSVNSLIP
jgi:hypothetical protein